MPNYLFYDFSGGLNQECSKSNAGINPKKLFWSDSYNIELHKNSAIKSMSGNKLIYTASENIISILYKI